MKNFYLLLSLSLLAFSSCEKDNENTNSTTSGSTTSTTTSSSSTSNSTTTSSTNAGTTNTINSYNQVKTWLTSKEWTTTNDLVYYKTIRFDSNGYYYFGTIQVGQWNLKDSKTIEYIGTSVTEEIIEISATVFVLKNQNGTVTYN